LVNEKKIISGSTMRIHRCNSGVLDQSSDFLITSKFLTICMLCCDQKVWATSVQSFTLSQQATIEIAHHDSLSHMLVNTFNPSPLVSAEIARHDHSIIACSCHTVLFFMHILFKANRTFNTTTKRLQQFHIKLHNTDEFS